MDTRNQQVTSAPKHTPGPWEVRTNRRESGYDQMQIWAKNAFQGRDCNIAIVASYPLGSSCHVNAALLAAAPDLLEALKRAYQQCVEFLNEGDFRRKVEWDAGYIVDAIAKAEGRK